MLMSNLISASSWISPVLFSGFVLTDSPMSVNRIKPAQDPIPWYLLLRHHPHLPFPGFSPEK